jgi:hypothetical protein
MIDVLQNCNPGKTLLNSVFFPTFLPHFGVDYRILKVGYMLIQYAIAIVRGVVCSILHQWPVGEVEWIPVSPRLAASIDPG